MHASNTAPASAFRRVGALCEAAIECNDIAVLYPPGRVPIFVAAYYTGSSAPVVVLAEVGRLVTASRW